MLGVADAELLFGAAEAIAAEDGRAAIEVVDALARSGRDPARFAVDLVAHLRQLLVIGTIGEIPSHFLVVAENEARLSDQARRLGEVQLVRAIDQLSAALAADPRGRRAADDGRAGAAALRASRDRPLARGARAAARAARAVGTGRCAGPRPSRRPPRLLPRPRLPERLTLRGSSEPRRRRPPPTPSRIPSRSGDSEPDSAVAAIAQGAVATAEQARTRVGEAATGAVAQAGASAQAASEVLDLDRVAGLWPAVLDQVTPVGSGSPVGGDQRRPPGRGRQRSLGGRARIPAERRLQPAQGGGEGEPRADRRGDPDGRRRLPAPGLRDARRRARGCGRHRGRGARSRSCPSEDELVRAVHQAEFDAEVMLDRRPRREGEG